MSDPIQTYTTRVSGIWRPRHTVLDGDGQTLGVLTVTRNRAGMVVAGEYHPEVGEVLTFRREPGLLRAQFSLWTDGKEWLGSSLRWNVGRRQIDLWTGSRPYRLVPDSGFRRSWRLVASKTGVAATVSAGLATRGSTLEVFRKLDFELLLFAYFLGQIVLWESLLPTTLDPMHQEARSSAASRA